MAAEQFDLSVANECPLEPGADFELRVTYNGDDDMPLDLTSGWSALAQIRHNYSDDTPALELDVVLGDSDDNIILTAEGADTAALQDLRRAVWDLLVIGPSEHTRLLEGKVQIVPASSRVP